LKVPSIEQSARKKERTTEKKRTKAVLPRFKISTIEKLDNPIPNGVKVHR
jgi:hypothetical protein